MFNFSIFTLLTTLKASKIIAAGLATFLNSH